MLLGFISSLSIPWRLLGDETVFCPKGKRHKGYDIAMCGICGKLMFDSEAGVSRQLLAEMMQLMAHRGPDDEGIYLGGPVGLGHRRLSIVDVSGGGQPLSNEDDSVWVVFNGEIYNHAMVRARLEAKGHRYKTRSDTETIVHAYEEYGPDCVKHLWGMFAFAIWDARNRSLFLARDRFGIKPLYYWHGTDGFAFASELKALLVDPRVEVTLDPVALYDFFTFRFIPCPRSPYREIRKVPPAHFITIKDGIVTMDCYWEPKFEGISSRSRAEHLEELDALLTEVIRDHLMSEVPQGVFLSGGVDSSLITALMAKVVNEPLITFSIGFKGYRGFDESGYAEQVATVYQTSHNTFSCGPESVAHMDDLIWHLEEPLADASMIALYELCHRATGDVTVVHGGDGGDEAFGGYPRFFWDEYAELYGRIPSALRQRALAPVFQSLQLLPGSIKEVARRAEKYSKFAGLTPSSRYMNWFTLIDETVKHTLLTPEFLEQVAAHRSEDVFATIYEDAHAIGLDPLGTRQYCELRSFIPDDLMLKADKIGMSASLEARYPFLDHRLIEFGLKLPRRHKMGYRQLKVLLKELLAKYMPSEFAYRKKQGFEVPISHWFRTELDDTLRETIAESEVSKDGILNGQFLKQMVSRLHAGDPVAGRQLFVPFIFQRWRRQFESPRQFCAKAGFAPAEQTTTLMPKAILP